MELFSIQCDTCASRLKVRQLSAIGQILACPKCGSMIQVEPPEGWTPPEVDPNEKTASEDSEPGSEQAANLPGKASAAAVKQRQVVVGRSKKPKKAAPTPKTEDPAAKPVLPNEQWTNRSTRQRQKVALLICCAAGVLIVALSIIGFLVSQIDRRDAPKLAQNQDQTEQTPDTSSNPDRGEKGTAGESVNGSSDNSNESGNAKPNAGGDSKNSAPNDTGNNEKLDVTDGMDDPSADDNADDQSKPNRPVLIGNNAGKNGGAGNERNTNPETNLEQTGPAPEIENGQSILDRLGPVVSGMIKVPDLRSGAFNLDHESQIGIGDLYVPRPVARKIDLQILLQFKPGFYELTDKSLSQFCKAVARLSGIPIQLDVDSMRYHGISTGQTVSYSGEDDTVEMILLAAIEPVGLTVERKDWGLLVVPAGDKESPTKASEVETPENPLVKKLDAATEGLIERDYQIFEIEEDSEERYEEFVAFVKLRFDPNSWIEKDGKATIVRNGRELKISQTQNNHYWIDRYFSRINRCREIVLGKATSNQDSLLLTDIQSAQSILNRSSELDIIVPESILTVFGKVETETGLRIVIDWGSLTTQGWTPATMIPWEGNGEAVVKTLERICRSMQLGYRIVDSETVQLTTRQNIDQQYSLELYPCHKLRSKMSERQLRSQVAAAFGDQINSAKGMSAMYYEPAQCIVAILPQSLHRRLQKIVEILEQD